MDQTPAIIELAKELGITVSDRALLGRQVLIDRINELLLRDFNRLVSILYQTDIDENRLQFLLDQYKGQDTAPVIADLLIERQLQKIKTRKKFGKKDEDIDENEKW